MKTSFQSYRLEIFLSTLVMICCSAFVANPKNPIIIIGNGKLIKENRKITNFSSIIVKDGLDLYLTQSDSEQVVVEAEENLLSYIVTEVEKNTLTIYTNKNMKATKPMKVFVNFSSLIFLEGYGGSDIYAKQTISLDELKVKVGGGSDIQLNIKTNKLLLEAGGGSDAELFGFAENATLYATGGSDIKAGNIEIINCLLSVSGGSDAVINVKEKLEGKASGGSDIIYSGNPPHVILDISGGSDCIKKNGSKK